MATLLTVLGATASALALPVAALWLRHVGPAARVVFYDYLPVEELATFLWAAPLGAMLFLDARRRRWSRGRLLALGLLLAWVAAPQLLAFPAHASLAERDAWARRNVRHYPALTRIVRALPALHADLGRVVALAPTSSDQHVFAREMNGDDLRFTLEVVGEKGRGTFHVDCTLDEQRVYDWRQGRWTFAGRQTRVEVDDMAHHAPAK